MADPSHDPHDSHDSHDSHDEEYTPQLLAVMQLLWGDGFLSPGGETHLAAIVAGIDLAGKRVLDVGCAIGGFDVALARDYGATVVGLDVETGLVEDGIRRVAKAGLEDRVELRVYEPGRLPVPDASFDVVFGKDSWIHIEDKRSFFADVHRALVPGGTLAAGDWLRSERPYGEDMLRFFELEGLTYHMDTLESYGAILREGGFIDVRLEDIHAEYRAMAHAELTRLETDLAPTLRDQLGPQHQEHFVENWRAMTKVLDSGDLRPGRLRARKPEA